MTDVVLAVVWIATGAFAIGTAVAFAGRRAGRPATVLPWLLSLGILLVVSIWLVLPVTAFGRTIDTSAPTDIECGSAWGSLGGSPWIYTDAGREYDLGSGECQAAAWHRAAALGSAEVGLAMALGVATVLQRRDPESAAREADRTASI